MTAESLTSYESTDNVRELRIVKTSPELSARAVPPVVEWGPAHLRDEEQPLPMADHTPLTFED